MSLREIAHATGKSLSTIKRMSTNKPAELEKLVDSLLDGSRDVRDEEPPARPGTLAQFEGCFIATHILLAILRYSIRESNPDIAAQLTEILKTTQPWVDWLEAD